MGIVSGPHGLVNGCLCCSSSSSSRPCCTPHPATVTFTVTGGPIDGVTGTLTRIGTSSIWHGEIGTTTLSTACLMDLGSDGASVFNCVISCDAGRWSCEITSEVGSFGEQEWFLTSTLGSVTEFNCDPFIVTGTMVNVSDTINPDCDSNISFMLTD